MADSTAHGACVPGARRASLAPGTCAVPGGACALPGQRYGYAGLFVAGLIVPFSISVLIVASSACSEAGTLLAKSW